MENLNLLYDHYKDTFELLKKTQNERNRNFAFLCILESFSLFMISDLNEASQVFSTIVSAKLEESVVFGNVIVTALLWFLILYFTIRYFQNNIYIERQYNYIHVLEKAINKSIDEFDFLRESKNYLDKYPYVLDMIGVFYTWIIPVAFICINVFRCVKEFLVIGVKFSTILDSAICLFIIVLTVLYIIFMKSYLIEELLNKIKKEGDEKDGK